MNASCDRVETAAKFQKDTHRLAERKSCKETGGAPRANWQEGRSHGAGPTHCSGWKIWGDSWDGESPSTGARGPSPTWDSPAQSPVGNKLEPQVSPQRAGALTQLPGS